jgi:hypothetical protein
MTAPHASDIINGYLARLQAETADIPATERRELLDSVQEHITEARAELGEETDADLLNMLDRLGHPAELAAAERERLDITPPAASRPGWLELGALILTPLFWPVGVILLWTSNAWNTRDKLIGTLVPPGGFMGVFLLLDISVMSARGQGCGSAVVNGHTVYSSCATPPAWEGALGMIVFLLVVISPILSGIYLGIQLRRQGSARLTPSLT